MKKLIALSLLAATMFMVLALPRTAAAESQTVVEIAVADGRFTTLVAAVTAAGLADDLSAGEWTVFAPTDAAFAKLGLNAGNIADYLHPRRADRHSPVPRPDDRSLLRPGADPAR